MPPSARRPELAPLAITLAVRVLGRLTVDDAVLQDRVLGISLPRWIGPVGLVGILLTVLYSELGAEEVPEPDQLREEAQEGAQDEAREELAGS